MLIVEGKIAAVRDPFIFKINITDAVYTRLNTIYIIVIATVSAIQM